MAADSGGAGQVADRGLVEDAVKLLLAQAPPGWTQLHGEFEPAAQPVLAVASVTAPGMGARPLPVPGEVLGALAEHQRRAATAGAPWRRLVIDCHADGRLAVRTDPVAAVPRPPRRWPQRVLAAITVGCLAAAAVVFAVGWRSSPPPRAAMIPVPKPPERQVMAFTTMQAWFAAENRGDAAGMRAVACAHPAPVVEDEILGIEQQGNTEGITYLEAVVAFRDEGARVWAKFASRVHPLSEAMARDVADAQKETAGFFKDQYFFVMEDGTLKVCDSDAPQGE